MRPDNSRINKTSASDSYADDEAFLYERHRTAPGIKLETVCGGAGYSYRAWELLARQVWCENAREGYRTIDHTDKGAPLLTSDSEEGDRQRISVSHTPGLFAVATLPPTDKPCDLETFSPSTALGLDVERADRSKVINVRERFLNDTEAALIPADDVAANILAWTCKEAMIKLSFNTYADIRRDLIITEMPDLSGKWGCGFATLPDGTKIAVELYSLPLCNGRYVATLAYTKDTLRFGTKTK